MELKICHLYPDVLFGERGNVICLKQRLLWRGIDCTVTRLPVGTQADLDEFDLFFLGGGEDFEQNALLQDLAVGRGEAIRVEVEAGKVFLAVGGGMQLMGKYREKDGEKTDFIGAADFYTTLDTERLTGNLLFSCAVGADSFDLVGFENHGGRSYPGADVEVLGKVVAGHGSNGQDGCEGFRYKNLFCTYCGGPILAKNPAFADFLLLTALKNRYPDAALSPLDDSFEQAAHDAMRRRLTENR